MGVQYLLSGEGAAPPLPALRGTVGASCWPPAWMLWRESSGSGSGIVDLLSDRCSSPYQRHYGPCQHASGEGADLTLAALTRSGQDSCWCDAAPVVRGRLGCTTARLPQRRNARIALRWSSAPCLPCCAPLGKSLLPACCWWLECRKVIEPLLVCCVRSSVRSV